jgi:phage-related protein
MALLIFDSPVSPSEPLQVETAARVLENEFGEGFKQRAPDGLNNLVRSAKPQWPRLSDQNADLIEAFLRGQLGAIPFLWLKPGDADYSQWICKTWSRVSLVGGKANLSASFEEDFSL